MVLSVSGKRGHRERERERKGKGRKKYFAKEEKVPRFASLPQHPPPPKISVLLTNAREAW